MVVKCPYLTKTIYLHPLSSHNILCSTIYGHRIDTYLFKFLHHFNTIQSLNLKTFKEKEYNTEYPARLFFVSKITAGIKKKCVSVCVKNKHGRIFYYTW